MKLAVAFMLLLTVIAAPPTTAPADVALGERILAFCRERVGQQLGDGECSSLADSALQAAGARHRREYPEHPGAGDYVWGTLVVVAEAGEKRPSYELTEGLRPEPGDVVQFRNARFEGTLPGNRWYKYEAGHHTAVLLKVAGRRLTVLHQNWNGNRFVGEATYNLADLKAGWVRIYRPQRADAPSDGE